MKEEIRAYTPQQVIEDDFLRAIDAVDKEKRADLYSQMDQIRQNDPDWFNLLISTFGPLMTSEYLSPGEKP